MIKAVFFDLYHTLVRYEPPREELQSKALKQFGIEASPERLRQPLAVADEFIYQEIVRVPLRQRSDEEKMALYAQYQKVLLKEAGIQASERVVLGLLGMMRKAEMNLVLFDDVMPAIKDLKTRGLVLGLISNVDRDIAPLLNELGLASLLQVVVTSQDAGFNKPHPGIFVKALTQAKMQPAEAMYVGDHYQVDVLGAKGAGMKGILLDRSGHFKGPTDSPKVQSLSQIADYL